MKGKKKIEPKEQTTASSSGAVDTTMNKVILKKDLMKKKEVEGEFSEATDASSSGAFSDVPAFGKNTKGGRKDPLAIGGPKTIGQSRAVKDKKWPKFGGPGGVYVQVKEKCKKFPYCTQGDVNNIQSLREAIDNTAKKYGIPVTEVEKIVLNEIKRIFI